MGPAPLSPPPPSAWECAVTMPQDARCFPIAAYIATPLSCSITPNDDWMFARASTYFRGKKKVGTFVLLTRCVWPGSIKLPDPSRQPEDGSGGWPSTVGVGWSSPIGMAARALLSLEI